MSILPSRRSPASASKGGRLSHSQNFIFEPKLVKRLLSHVELGASGTIIEIGPGKGALTVQLIELAPHVLAVEADPGLAQALLKRFASCRRLTLAHGDFLGFPLPARPFIVVSNIPFNRTAEIVRKLTSEQSGLQAAYLILQREAARKFIGQPDCPQHLLSHFLHVDYAVNVICTIPRSCFSPKPRVDAAFTLFRKRKAPVLNAPEAQQYRDLLSYLFPRGPRLLDALKQVLSRNQLKRLCQHLGLDQQRRLREVSFAEWLAIYQVYAEHSSPAAHRKIQGAHTKLAREQAGLCKRHRTSRW